MVKPRLDNPNQLESAREIGFQAHAILRILGGSGVAISGKIELIWGKSVRLLTL
jgi:hypothetical protein